MKDFRGAEVLAGSLPRLTAELAPQGQEEQGEKGRGKQDLEQSEQAAPGVDGFVHQLFLQGRDEQRSQEAVSEERDSRRPFAG